MILPDGSTQNCPACAIYHTHRKSMYTYIYIFYGCYCCSNWKSPDMVSMGEILAYYSMPGNTSCPWVNCCTKGWFACTWPALSLNELEGLAVSPPIRPTKPWKSGSVMRPSLSSARPTQCFSVFLGFCLGASACQTWSFLSGKHAEMLSQLGLLPPSPSPNKRTSALMGSLNFVFSKLHSSDLTNVPSDIFLHSCSSRWPEASVSNRRKASHVSVSDFVVLNTASKMPDLNLDRAFAANSD